MTGVGKTQGYTGKERKNESSDERGDEGKEGEEEVEDMRGVFFGIKQKNLHVQGGFRRGSDV